MWEESTVVFLLAGLLAATAGSVVDTTVGEYCEVPCSGSVGKVRVLEWTKERKHLLFYRSDKIIWSNQHQPYRNRVQLKEPELNTGTFTIMLKNVTQKDSGAYVCEGLVQTAGGKEESFYKTVNLRVSEETADQAVASARVADNNQKDSINPSNPPKNNDDGVAIEDANQVPLAVIIPLVVLISIGIITATVFMIWKRVRIKRTTKLNFDPSNQSTPIGQLDTQLPISSSLTLLNE